MLNVKKFNHDKVDFFADRTIHLSSSFDKSFEEKEEKHEKGGVRADRIAVGCPIYIQIMCGKLYLQASEQVVDINDTFKISRLLKDYEISPSMSGIREIISLDVQADLNTFSECMGSKDLTRDELKISYADVGYLLPSGRDDVYLFILMDNDEPSLFLQRGKNIFCLSHLATIISASVPKKYDKGVKSDIHKGVGQLKKFFTAFEDIMSTEKLTCAPRTHPLPRALCVCPLVSGREKRDKECRWCKEHIREVCHYCGRSFDVLQCGC